MQSYTKAPSDEGAVTGRHSRPVTEGENPSHPSSEPIGLYLHIPFCRSKCVYCDFCSFPRPDEALMSAYVDELIRRMERAPARDREVDTVYFGGGTPTLLPPLLVRKLTEAIHANFRILPDAEITVECNPTGEIDWTPWVAGGINRVSMGVQSMQDAELHRLGRRHRAADVSRTVADVRRAGIRNVNLDVMLGIPEQTAASLEDTLEKMLALEPTHLSAYCLTVEEGTPLDRLLAEGRITIPDEEQTLALYEQVCRTLASHGWEHYEISNFAKAGYCSLHNTHTWQYREYLGLGVAAHSFLDGERFGNSRDMDAFLRGEDIVIERNRPTGDEMISEYVMLALRLSDGLCEQDFLLRFGKSIDEVLDAPLDPFIQQGLMTHKNGRVALTEQGFAVSNAILSDILPL